MDISDSRLRSLAVAIDILTDNPANRAAIAVILMDRWESIQSYAEPERTNRQSEIIFLGGFLGLKMSIPGRWSA